MEIFLAIGLPLLLTIGLPILFSVIGEIIERRHEADLARRESAIVDFPVRSTSPTDLGRVDVELLSSSVVIGTGYLKQLFASFRTMVGGEIVSLTRVLDRGRREAYLRVVEDARQRGGTGLINIRFETSDVGGQKPSSEILCYATMIREL